MAQETVDKYYTIKDRRRTEIKIKGSKFIGTAIPVKTKEEALEKLQEIRSEFYDATHNCFSWQIGWDKNEFRYSDDGEPSGSAGKPIFQAINKFGLSDLLVVVTRYFGGTKLGVGGLIRAYSDSAEDVLNNCTRKTIHRTAPVFVECKYEEISAVKRLIDEFAVSFDEKYTDKVEFTINVHLSKVDTLVNNLVQATLGQAKINTKKDNNENNS